MGNVFDDIESIVFPMEYKDIDAIYNSFIFEGEKDEDVFTYNEIKEGRSYYMYGKKVMEFRPGENNKARLRFFPIMDGEVIRTLTTKSSQADLVSEIIKLKKSKKYIFRNTIEDVFGCCHDFKKCSEVDACIHTDDRFYNGCIYRKNLEAGRNFYKETSSLYKHEPFTSILGLDFETANANRSSACAVGAVKYDCSGKELKRVYQLINPHEDFDFFNIMIHGIRPEMVKDSPSIHDAMKAVFALIDDRTLIVCHNSAFDMSVLRNSLQKEPLEIPDFLFTCTYRLASRILPKNISYTLPDVAEQCGIIDLDHHNAASDAATSAKILMYLINMFEGDVDRLHQTANINYGKFINGQYDGIHKARKESLEVNSIKKRSYTLPQFTVGQESPFYGKTVAFTGKLESMTRDEAIQIIDKIGGIGTDTFSKKVNVLVTGYQNKSVLAGKEKSSKRIAAEKMLEEGLDIEIIPEEQFIKML